jgi:aarF domain-containing kinase
LQVSLPGHICAVVVTTLVLEGWSSKLDPGHSTLQEVQKIVRSDRNSWPKRAAQAVDHALRDPLPRIAHVAWI